MLTARYGPEPTIASSPQRSFAGLLFVPVEPRSGRTVQPPLVCHSPQLLAAAGFPLSICQIGNVGLLAVAVSLAFRTSQLANAALYA
jgi:hypothetical protein